VCPGSTGHRSPLAIPPLAIPPLAIPPLAIPQSPSALKTAYDTTIANIFLSLAKSAW